MFFSCCIKNIHGREASVCKNKLGKGGTSTVPNSSGNVQELHPRRAREQHPHVHARVFNASRSSLGAGAPPALFTLPFPPLPPSPMCFYSSREQSSVRQIQLHSWLGSTCLFSVPARRLPAPLAPLLRGGGRGGREQGRWGGKQEQAAAFQTLICLKLKPV